MSPDRTGTVYARLEELERRSEITERELSAAISKLSDSIKESATNNTKAIEILVSKIDSLLEFNQKYLIYVLLLVAGIFFGKEILLNYLTKFH